jgi:Iron/manganese superoxide dismutases, C-terminal domain
MLAVAVADQLAAVGGHNFNEAQEIGAVADAMADGGNLVAGLEGVFVPAGAGHAAGAGPSGDRAHRGGTHAGVDAEARPGPADLQRGDQLLPRRPCARSAHAGTGRHARRVRRVSRGRDHRRRRRGGGVPAVVRARGADHSDPAAHASAPVALWQRLWQRLLGRPASESGTLRHGDGTHGRSDRCRRSFVLPILLAGGRPILALDMFEHSYHIDYGAKSAVYVDAFMNVIRWDNPAKLYDRYSREAS